MSERSRTRSWRRLAVPALLVGALAACGSGEDAGAGFTASRRAGRTPTGSPTGPTKPPGVTSGPGSGVLAVRVKDSDGRGRSDVPISFTGTRAGTLLTGTDGTARKRLPAGRYHLTLKAGCHRRVIVKRSSGGGRVGLSANSTITVPFAVQMQRRYAPSGPVTWTPEPPWPRGKTVTFAFAIYDRCTDKPAPGTSFADLSYDPSEHLALLDATPRRSDGEAMVTITFRCVKAGDAELFLADPQNAKDGTDLLSIRAPFAPVDWCA